MPVKAKYSLDPSKGTVSSSKRLKHLTRLFAIGPFPDHVSSTNAFCGLLAPKGKPRQRQRSSTDRIVSFEWNLALGRPLIRS